MFVNSSNTYCHTLIIPVHKSMMNIHRLVLAISQLALTDRGFILSSNRAMPINLNTTESIFVLVLTQRAAMPSVIGVTNVLKTAILNRTGLALIMLRFTLTADGSMFFALK